MARTIQVGLFFAAALVLLAALVMRIEEFRLFGPKGRRVVAEFTTVVGLDDRSAVRVAGVRVGRVDGIALDRSGRGARVTLLLEAELDLTEGAIATIANQGMLGDKFVELDPGPAGGTPLAADAVLPGRSAVGFDQAMAKLDEIGESVRSALGGLSTGEGGGIGELVASLRRTADELGAVIAENRTSFGGTMKNFERFSATLAQDLPRISAQLERALGQIDAVVTENRGNLKDGLASVRELASSVQTSVDHLNTITGKIARGEGTVGKLINSEEAHDELLGALKSVESGVTKLGDTLGRVERIRLDVGLEGQLLAENEESRSALRIDVAPNGDESLRLYRFELVGDPYGRVSENRETITVTRPDGATETTTVARLDRDVRRSEYSALVGFPFAERKGALWAGLIENSGGVAIDYRLIPDRLQLSLEAYDFSRELDLDPHLRLTARWTPWKNLYLSAGYDDPLVDEFRSAFVGAGVRWSDDELKYLVGSLPSF